ncbi:hypothetical protein SEA_MABODAMACA_70 [Microbacterium phage Mabodamaca]|uniref:Uncharacterized protein n=1 Tax=Microbacterium phage Mabodamaca TaxID=3078574 RepID=A0AA96SJC0_9CAUD|nr:hypothetical protein SEA_MABODAMACA_70 [Microbacterium phage Mabodamaca]
MNTEAAKNLLAAIAAKGIELAISLGKLDPATASEEQINAAGTAAVLAAMEMEPAVKEAMLHLTAERFHAAHN